MSYTWARVLFSRIFRVLFHVSVVGAENIPREGGLVVCCNHRANADPFFLGMSINRTLFYMAKAELFKIPVLNLFFLSLGAFPVHRGTGDKRAAEKSLQILRRGRVLAMFPEGHRQKEGDMPARFKTGAVRFAAQAGVPVLPTAVICNGKPKMFFQHKIVAVGKPIYKEELAVSEDDPETVRRASALVRERVIKLIEANRGNL